MAHRRIKRTDVEYPPLLTEIADPPATLWAEGGPLEPAPYLAVVGSRRATRYGLATTKLIAGELAAAGIWVVSGMAMGIDTAAHQGALEVGGRTVAVLGTGIDLCYPRRNRELFAAIKQRGTAISEFAPGTQARPHHFPQRNRIIAGVCLGVLITEGRVGGGAMITARLAMETGREVFALAGPVHSEVSEGPHRLVRDGARLVTGSSDILEDLGLEAPAKPDQMSLDGHEFTPDERAILMALEATPVLLDSLARAVRMPASGASAVLATLELKGFVERHPGARFALAVGISRN